MQWILSDFHEAYLSWVNTIHYAAYKYYVKNCSTYLGILKSKPYRQQQSNELDSFETPASTYYVYIVSKNFGILLRTLGTVIDV